MKAFAAICLLLVAATVAEAQYGRACYSRPTYYPTYTAPTYYTAPVYYPPTYVAPYALPVPLVKDYYYSIDGSYRDKILVDAIEGRMAARDRTFMVELFKQFQQLQQPQPQVQPQYQKQPMPSAPKVEDLQQPKTTVPDKLQAVVDSKCIKCHKGASAKGRADFSDLATVSERLRWKAFGMVVTNEMPEGAPPLSDDEVILFNKWAKLARPVSVQQGDVLFSPVIRGGVQ